MESDLVQLRQELHWLIDALPEAKLQAIRILVEPPSLAESLASAPYEDEELTPETVASIERARASLRRGEGISHDEILREFGM